MRYFLELAYKGTYYHGWQIQPNAVSVQEVLDKTLSTLLAEPIHTLGCGRTDTGVHAKEFYAHFDTTRPVPEQLIHNLNGMLPQDIAAKRFIPVNDDAHARFDATSRSYEYHMHFAKDAFLTEFSFYHPRKKPDLERMNEVAQLLLSHEDFACFSKSHAGSKTTLCIVTEARWESRGEQLIFHISANRFLRNMVRAIVGTLLDAGMGKIDANDFKKILESKNRSEAGTSVPANGLYLTRIQYPYL